VFRNQQHELVNLNNAGRLVECKGSCILFKLLWAGAGATALSRGQAAFDAQQWQENGTASHYSFAVEQPASLMADSLYAQLLADSVGLGSLIDEKKMKAHLQTEALWNDSPHGLRVESKSGVSTGSGEAVWQGGSPNW
jgi:hypothetical protein